MTRVYPVGLCSAAVSNFSGVINGTRNQIGLCVVQSVVGDVALFAVRNQTVKHD
jgi:hypothetical protein